MKKEDEGVSATMIKTAKGVNWNNECWGERGYLKQILQFGRIDFDYVKNGGLCPCRQTARMQR